MKIQYGASAQILCLASKSAQMAHLVTDQSSG
jgi:hypothetical protein